MLYAADFQANGQYKPENTRQYKPENTRQSLATSSRLLGEQIRHWGTDGITYDIVGHSLGGTVATHWLATETDPATRRAVRSIVTMDSPVNGARNAQGEAARWLSLSGQAGLDLQDNSAGGTIAKMGAALASGKVVTLANTRDLVVVSTTSYEVGTCPDSLSGCLFDLGFLTADAAKLWHFGILQASEPMIRLDKVLAGVSVTGQVIDSVTQQGVGDATVELVDVVLSTVTNADGTFTLQSVPPSTKQQTLRVSKSGYQTRADITVTANTTGPISLPAPIQLTSTTGTLTGTVTAGMGGPGLDGVSVQVQGTTGSATTGNGGQFSFIGMLPGTYTILASREGYQSGSQSVTIGAGANPPITIPLTLISTRVQRVTVVGSTQANSSSDLPTISGDGRYVAFFSHASNLVPNDTNGVSDIFVWDRLTQTTERVSVAADGTQANERSVAVSINTDGRYVAFQSLASNLVPGDTNDHADIFVKDRSTGVVERVSTTSDGSQLAISVSADPSISGDGRYVAFRVDAPELSPPPRHVHVYVKDRQTGLTVRASETAAGVPGNGSSHSAQISANGRYVAFSSSAENLVPGSTDGIGDVYLKDLQTGAIIRASTAADGAQANAGGVQPALSADGRFVAFYSDATNLVSGDTNGERDVFVKDRDTGQVHRVNVANDGSQADETSSTTDISSDGRFVVFNSLARNLVPGDTVFRFDVFIVDRQAGTIQRVSTPVNGLQSNGDSTRPRVSADGRFVVF